RRAGPKGLTWRSWLERKPPRRRKRRKGISQLMGQVRLRQSDCGLTKQMFGKWQQVEPKHFPYLARRRGGERDTDGAPRVAWGGWQLIGPRGAFACTQKGLVFYQREAPVSGQGRGFGFH